MRRIAISSGHGLYIRGASASPNPEPYNDEVDEVRQIVDQVHDLLTSAGHACVKFHDNTSTSQSANLDRIVDWHNSQSRDLDVSVHLNANQTTSSPMGCEVLFVTQETLAEQVSAAIATAGHFKDRGEKYRGDLAFLNGTSEPAILLECWFCDSSADCANGRQYRDAICEAIAEKIADVELDDIEPPAERPPIEPPERPPEITEQNYIEMRTASTGGVQVLINGATIHGAYVPGQPVVDLTLTGHGDVCMAINGEMFHNHPPAAESEIPVNQRNIITTVFGGDADNEYSAYGPYDSQGRGPYLDDDDMYVSLPWTVPGAGRDGGVVVKVTNRANGKSEKGWVGDKGPWFVDDCYPETGDRPLAEQCYLLGEPCPRGPNQGTIPNGAGIDISPAMAKALGIEGKGQVDWMFVEAEV
jgi:N-acetylmuramoyl-L-alanine amidase